MGLNGNVPPRARPEYDRGRVRPNLAISRITLELTKTAAQQADLDRLLVAQRTLGSPEYHHWLTPEQYGQRFGVSDADIASITQWLQAQGISVTGVARGKDWIAASGTAAQVEAAFQTEIHEYAVNGETHFANSAEPSVPAAFDHVIGHIRGLNDFRPKARRSRPRYTDSTGNYIAPDDFATIYDVKPLYAAGINGAGQKMVIAGQTQVKLSDVRGFRSRFNLPPNDPQLIPDPNSTDPGFVPDDAAEADLDLEWAGAVARNATILYVYAYDALSAVQYAIDNDLAPVVSVSYGLCEQEESESGVLDFQSWAQKGNVEGITWFGPSGDSGAADCDDGQYPGYAVDAPASVPEVTGVGGTEFAEGSGQYWNSANDANGASALSYIPETAWNDSSTDGSPDSTGGGASIFFAKPSWQTGPGVPNDGARDVPDIALNASNDHDGYLVDCNSASTGGSNSCSASEFDVFGGTSVPTPSFAALMVLLNQYLAASTPGLGNINPNLYSLAHSNPDIFHDVTTGNNIVTVGCVSRRTCDNTPIGFTAGVGYDQTTGLGSVDAYRLITEWTGGGSGGGSPGPGSDAITLLSNLTTAGTGDTVYLIASITNTGGSTPAGNVAFSVNGTALGSIALEGSAGSATATLAVRGSQLPLGPDTFSATFGAGSNALSGTAIVNVKTAGSNSGGVPAISGLANGASFKTAFAPGGILTVFGSQLAPATAQASSVPLPISLSGVAVLINGEAAPLYYISPGQLNVQIPYEIAAGSTAVLSVNNNGAVATQTFLVSASAPGIFADQNGVVVPVSAAAAGQEIAIYITGAGGMSPAIATGAAPAASIALADLPAPNGVAKVTVGGQNAFIDFIGIPYGLVGVTQINFTVPSGIAAGAQPVIASIGGVASAAAQLNVTP